jgi:hypothetical protein
VNLKCTLCLSVCLCCLSAMKVQARDGQGRVGLHCHPQQDQFLHENFYSTWHMPDNPSVGALHPSGTGFCFALGDAT